MAAERTGAAAGGIDRGAVRRHFGRAVATYDGAAVLQREVGARLAARLDVVRLDPRRILDAGCGTGDALGEFAVRYPGAARFGLDLALPMLACARAKTIERRTLASRLLTPFAARPPAAPLFACGDLAALPFAAGAFDLVWSNLALQWVPEPEQAFAELPARPPDRRPAGVLDLRPGHAARAARRLRRRRRRAAREPLHRPARPRRHAGRARASATR